MPRWLCGEMSYYYSVAGVLLHLFFLIRSAPHTILTNSILNSSSSNNIGICTGLLVDFISPVIILLSLSKDLPIAHTHIHLYTNIFMIYVYFNIHIICMLLRTHIIIYLQAPLFFNQLHYYNTHMNTYTVVSVERSPKPVAGHCACVLSDKMIIFGGSQQGQGTK